VLSGVNRGRNAAEDVTYSGTVAGAMEGTVLGIPSFALSQAYSSVSRAKPLWETAIRFAPDLIRRVLARACRATCWSTSISRLSAGRGEGGRGRHPGQARPGTLRIEPRHDGRATRTTGSHSRAASW